MRQMVFALFAFALVSAPAVAAPICQNKLGDWVHCDAPGAMPVGWRVPDAVYTARVLSRTPPIEGEMLVAVVVLLVAFFAFIALLPKFDGARGEDWEP